MPAKRSSTPGSRCTNRRPSRRRAAATMKCEKASPRGPLHGIPIGVKDIIDVRGQYTRCGTPVYPANIPARTPRPSPGSGRRGRSSWERPRRPPSPTTTRRSPGTPGIPNTPREDRAAAPALRSPTGCALPPWGRRRGVAPESCRLQRDRRLQGDLRRGEHRGGPPQLLEHRPRRLPLPLGGRRRDPLALHPREEPRPFARMPEPPLRSRRRIPGAPPRLGYIREFFEAETSPRSWKPRLRPGKFLAGRRGDRRNYLSAFVCLRGRLLEHHQAGGALRLSPAPFRGLSGDYPPKLKVRLEKGAADHRPRVCRTPPPPDPLPAGDV